MDKGSQNDMYAGIIQVLGLDVIRPSTYTACMHEIGSSANAHNPPIQPCAKQ